MKFETRKSRIITAAIGILLFVSLLGAVYVTNRMGSDYPPAVAEYKALYDNELTKKAKSSCSFTE